MRQVPHYLLIGNGQAAHHFRHYFSLLHLSYSTWQRQETIAQLKKLLLACSHILLLINDDAVEEFITTHLNTQINRSYIIIHCSGSVVSKHAYGVHPLMSFTHHLYELAQYHTIPFIIDHDAPPLAQLLPGLSNPHARLHTSLKAKYHAMCVLSGNFSCLLWQKLFTTFTHEFNLPPELSYPYLMRQTQNLMLNAKTALTGPLVRGDMATITKNLTALTADPWQAVYQSFVDCYLNKPTEDTV